MKTEKQTVAGYGLHYYANNQLVPNISVRTVLQCIVDLVRRQLSDSLDNQTIIVSLGQLGRMTGIDPYRTIPTCVNKLEALGLIKKHKNGITLMCDEYVAAVQLCETLPKPEKNRFIQLFQEKGIEALQFCRGTTKLQGREALLGISGSSITLESSEPLQKCRDFEYETSNPYKNVGVSNSDPKIPTILQGYPYNNVGIHETKVEIPTFLQGSDNSDKCIQCETTPTILQGLAEQIAKSLHFCRGYCNFADLCEFLTPTFLQGYAFELVKCAFETGKFPKIFTFDSENPYIFAGVTPTFLQGLASKTLQFCRTVIIGDNKKDIKGKNKSENEKIEEKNLEEGLEIFWKVDVINFDEPSEKDKKDLEGCKNYEVVDYSQQVLKRAEKTMTSRNPYRNKPFIKVEKIKDIVECLDEVVKSPVDFFLYQFWWGIYDLYCEHYNPSQKIDEEGELVDEPQLINWKEMIGAPLPQDEIYSLAKNVYDDLLGAVEQGRYVYGDSNEWEVKFSFSSFEDFIPYEIFQWTPCTMQDKSIPALRVAIDRFYDIEAPDVFIPGKGDKKVKNAQNKKLIRLILSTEDSQLTPMETAIKHFYRDFVITGENNIIDEFSDGKGIALESGGGLPDHLFKPWCYNLPSVRYSELTEALSTKYKPCDGIHKKAYIFSAEKVVEWNERNGFSETVAHQSLQ